MDTMDTMRLFSDALVGGIDSMESAFLRAVAGVIFVTVFGAALILWLWPREAWRRAPDVATEAASELAYPAPGDDEDEDETPPAAVQRPQRDVDTLPTLPAFPALSVGSGSPAEIATAVRAQFVARMEAMSGDDSVIVPVLTPSAQHKRPLTYCPVCNWHRPQVAGKPVFCHDHAHSWLARMISGEWSA